MTRRKLRAAVGDERPGLTVLLLNGNGEEWARLAEGLTAEQAVALYRDKRSDSELLLASALGEL